MASALAGINGDVPFFCNLVGAGFSPCATNAGYTGSGAGYPINFFQSNPYSGGYSSGEMVSAGYSNYNGLQVDLRQGAWHGLQYDTNYTFSHSLGLSSGNSWTGSYNAFTLRNLRQSYGPTCSTYAMSSMPTAPTISRSARGGSILTTTKALDAVLGGFTVGTIVTWQSGAPA